MRREIYIFSGLGADERVFQALDFSRFSINFIKWITPNENETIEHYASRIIQQIPVSNPLLIGLSFGGIMAIEVAKQIKTKKVILLASVKLKSEIPFYFRFFGKIGLHKFLPTSLLKKSNFITNYFFGLKSKKDKVLLKQILIDTDPKFLKWAIDKVARWNNLTQIPNIFHIHGTADRIFPLCFIKCDIKIKNGGHFMTLNKAYELNQILRNYLSF